VGGFLLASLGVCAAAEAQQTQAIEKKSEKKEVVSGNLAPTTIMANRTETELSKVGSSVTVLDVKTLDKQGVRSLDEALKFVSGLVSESINGQRGTGSSILIRGTKTNHAHLVVDGMRLSDANIRVNNFMGTSNLNGLSRVEVLKGAQGAMYGGDSIGGVIGIYSSKGEGDFSGRVRVEGGSFNSWNTMLGIQGSEGDFAYALDLGYESTDNDLPHNGFDMFSYALRLDYALNACVDIGMTLRGSTSNIERPKYGDPDFGHDADDDFDSLLSTLFMNYRVNEQWSTKVTFGFYDEKYVADTAGYSGIWGPVSPNEYTTDLYKYAIYWDNTYKWNDQHSTVFGAVYEKTKFKISSVNTPDPWGSNYKLDQSREQYGVYANHIWDVTENFNVSGGLRWEDYDDYGDEVTWRVASAYTLNSTDTIFRASLGKGFRPPSFSDLYGYNGQNPNPDLKAEKSLGWDFGVEQPFCDGRYKLGVTYFANRIENAMGYDSSYKTINIDGVSETSGIEASAEANFLDDRLNIIASYTWLDRSLQFQPDNVLGLRVNAEVTDSLNTGITGSYMDSRSYGGDSLDSYVLINLYGNYELTENVMFSARVENLFDEDFEYYSSSYGVYPGRGIGFFGGVTFSF